jgi:hypothetical protein
MRQAAKDSLLRRYNYRKSVSTADKASQQGNAEKAAAIDCFVLGS